MVLYFTKSRFLKILYNFIMKCSQNILYFKMAAFTDALMMPVMSADSECADMENHFLKLACKFLYRHSTQPVSP